MYVAPVCAYARIGVRMHMLSCQHLDHVCCTPISHSEQKAMAGALMVGFGEIIIIAS